jgi:ABC-type transport system substrate-binding protein
MHLFSLAKYFCRAALLLLPSAALAQPSDCTLRVAMTLSDLPTPSGGPNQGTEGLRFMGYTMYDSLINWDLSRADKPSGLVPGLALSWTVDPTRHTSWIFTLRPGVTFHDGSVFDADAVIFNLDKLLNHAAPNYDPAQAAQLAYRMPGVRSWRKIDAEHVEITTDQPDATLPYQMTDLLMSSPARWREAGSWEAFARNPSGTGPWMLEQYVPRDHVTLKRNPQYWNSARLPRCAHLELLPIPDPGTRTAALLSGQVDWIESPSPDTVPQLKSSGFQILTGVMPHIWPYTLNMLPGSPFTDIRVRRALNLAVNRDGFVELLGGLARPATGVVAEDSPWYGKPSFHISYDPVEARRLLAEAGYGPQHPLHVKFMISTAGSGQMYPLTMNEYMQQNLADVGVKLDLEVMEWQALRTRRDSAGGAANPINAGIDAINSSYNSMDPNAAFFSHIDSAAIPPAGLNWGNLKDPEIDRLDRAAREAFDPATQDALLAKLDQYFVDQAYWIFVVHDVNARAVSPHVHGVVEAQSWFVDFSPVTVTP